MTIIEHRRRLGASALAIGTSLALSGCFLSPGQFESTLDLRGDGAFSFSYDGQIYAFALDDLSEMAANADPDPCYDEGGEERPCTDEELEQQRAERVQQAQMMSAMMGGAAGPESGEELAEHLERQAGWNSVEYLGDGMFDVEFAVSGQLTYDFAFPTIEGMPSGTSFVAIFLRDEGKVRVEAPGFSPQAANPMAGMMSGMAGMFGASGADGENGATGGEAEDNPFANLPQPSGTFRIVTDGEILANNTDEGPSTEAGGKLLEWDITPQSAAAPTALIQLVP